MEYEVLNLLSRITLSASNFKYLSKLLANAMIDVATKNTEP